MRVPLLDLQAQYRAIAPEIELAIKRVMESGRYILGEDVGAFESEVAADFGVPYAIGVSSGTDALLAALWALGIERDDEVITTTMSFFSTAGSIARLGAVPVFADVDPETLNLDPRSALERVGDRTRALLPVHLFGRVADLTALVTSGIPIIEDAAQAYGAPGVCKLGKLATLSFFPSKNLGGAGDAGMVLTADADLAERVRLYRSHGARPKYIHHVVGANLRMDTLQAAILRVKRRYVAAWNQRRRHHATSYREQLAETPLVLPSDHTGVWHQFVVRAPRRDALRSYLRDREIETEVYYPRPLHQQPCFSSTCSLPVAERAATEVLALPIHPELEDAHRAWVVSAIREFYR